uniref:Uncharacterized protein n=1 Tax=Salix viminalis TaxID=40686 RepID=A0A6N2MZ40_SALVM
MGQGPPGNDSSGWIWLSTATCTRNETWWCSNAKFFCASCSAGSARPAPWRATWRWPCSTDPAASPSHAATDASQGTFLSLPTWS